MNKTILPLVLLLATNLASAEPLRTVKIVTDRAPDCSSLDSIVRTVTRGCETDDQRAIAIYNFCRYVYYHHAYPTEPAGVSALKMINVYGWSLCGGQHTVMAALWEKAGYRWRYLGWSRPGHSTVEVFYGGRWHYLDTFLKFYAWMPDANAPGGRTIAAQEDILTNPALLDEQFHYDRSRNVFYHRDNRFDHYGDQVNWTAPAFLVCGDPMEGVLSGVRSSKDHGSHRAWGSIHFDRPDYSTGVNLGPGYALSLDWDKIDGAFYFRNHDRGPMHTCGDKDYRNCPAIGPLLEPYAGLDPRRSWSNGTLVFEPDFRNHAFLDSFQKIQNAVWRDGALHPVEPSEAGAVLVEMASPYVVAKASFQIASEGASVEISPDRETWTPSATDDFTSLVAGRYRYYVRITFRKPLTAIRLTSIVQHNQESLPYLAPGPNRITVTSANPAALGRNRLVVTYAYRPGVRRATPEQLFDRHAEIARAHSADWSASPVVVQKTIDRFPYSFDIPVTTPKGSQPVYPRMLFIRRELLAPGQNPMSVPEPPTIPRVGTDELLPTLPNPWTIGTNTPQ